MIIVANHRTRITDRWVNKGQTLDLPEDYARECILNGKAHEVGNRPQPIAVSTSILPVAWSSSRPPDVLGNTHVPGLNFVIWALPFTLSSGGSFVLHKLGHNLSLLGHNVYFYADSKNPKWGGQLVPEVAKSHPHTPIPVFVAKPIVVYPEIICGNPLQAVYVVRWILNTPRVCGGDGVYGKDDLVMSWSNYFYIRPNNSAGLLTAWRDWSHFKDLGRPRSGSCYVVRKGFNRTLDKHPLDALCIDNYGAKGEDAYLVQIVNEKECFYCYDDNTALMDMAALCGCKAIMIPNGRTREEMWDAGVTLDGVAYGTDDIPRALATLPLLREKVQQRPAMEDQQTREFIQLCYLKWPEVRKPCQA